MRRLHEAGDVHVTFGEIDVGVDADADADAPPVPGADAEREEDGGARLRASPTARGAGRAQAGVELPQGMAGLRLSPHTA